MKIKSENAWALFCYGKDNRFAWFTDLQIVLVSDIPAKQRIIGVHQLPGDGVIYLKTM
jgi:hypothetical protein